MHTDFVSLMVQQRYRTVSIAIVPLASLFVLHAYGPWVCLNVGHNSVPLQAVSLAAEARCLPSPSASGRSRGRTGGTTAATATSRRMAASIRARTRAAAVWTSLSTGTHRYAQVHTGTQVTGQGRGQRSGHLLVHVRTGTQVTGGARTRAVSWTSLSTGTYRYAGDRARTRAVACTFLNTGT